VNFVNLDMRSQEFELMDTDRFEISEYEQTLKQLEILNRWSLGYAPTISAMKETIQRTGKTDLHILDVGFGGGDTLRHLYRWSREMGYGFRFSGIDLNPISQPLAERLTPLSWGINYMTGDVFNFVSDEKYDVIINSLVMHHLNHAQILKLLRWMTIHSKYAWFINDLHRHVVPYVFMKHVTRALRFNRLICHDAPLSVARSFRQEEWEKYLSEAGIPALAVDIKWHFPFRYGILCDTVAAASLRPR
jgi:2-polyprenyl-3-methyl-5-hydroxy-6-metoxy-1,4-benzoquinol methylase